MSRTDIYAFQSTIIICGVNSVTKVGPIAGVNSFQLKLLSGGTASIGGEPGSSFTGITGVSGVVGYSTTQAAANCYPLSANEIQAADFGGIVYIYNTGATSVIAINFGKSQGA